MDIIDIEKDRWEWSQKQFPDATAESSLLHLKKEIKEIESDLTNGTPQAEEYADALMCLLDSSKRAGISFNELIEAMHNKHYNININRTWVKTPDGDYRHV